MDTPVSQDFSFQGRLPQVITEPLGDIPSYYRRKESKKSIDDANLNTAGTLLGWFEMLHAYCGQPASKEQIKAMHRHANAVFGDGDESEITVRFSFEGEPKRMIVETAPTFEGFSECEQVAVRPVLRTETETAVSDMAVILDEIASRLLEFGKNPDDRSPYITEVRLGFDIKSEETTVAVAIKFDDNQRSEDAEVLEEASYCTAMQSLDADLDRH